MRLSNAITMFNNVFGTQGGRTSILALWTIEWLRSFTNDELNELMENITHERELGQGSSMLNRLVMRINDVKRERGLPYTSNTDTKATHDQGRQMETTTSSPAVLGVQG